MVLRNEEIAARIRELRGTKPQTLVADEMGVAERTYQNWELGETKPSYRSLQLLAGYFGVPEEFILTGGRRDLSTRPTADVTPDPFAAEADLPGEGLQDQLKEVLDLLREARSEQDRISGLLERQTAVLERIERATEHAHGAADKLDEAVAQAAKALRSAPPKPKRSASKTAQKRTPRASR